MIFPPVNTAKFAVTGKPTDRFAEYFLVVSRLVPYKRIDILIQAANQAQRNLLIIGEGSELKKLAKLAGPTVSFLGQVSEQELNGYYQNCQAFLQANEEDFGISMVEAQSAGKPVIAFAPGGASDIVIPGQTGLLLSENSVAAFVKAFTQFDTMTFVPSVCAQNAKRFDQLIWATKMQERIDKLCQTI